MATRGIEIGEGEAFSTGKLPEKLSAFITDAYGGASHALFTPRVYISVD